VGAPEPMLTALADAKKEISFKKALRSVKDAIPVTLLIKGHNPLTLLHKALNSGAHEMSDEKCLARAHDVRLVLAKLADRLAQALKDEADLNAAINRLMNAPKTE
jgi:(p)ppGpp synthase/HD superfamily hydrolase